MMSRACPKAGGRSSVRRWHLAVLLLAAGLQLSLPGTAAGQAQDARPGPMRFLRWTYQDAGHLARDAGRLAPLLLLVAPPLGATSAIDAPMLEGVQRGHGGRWPTYLDAANELGDQRMLPATAGLFALSLATENTRLQDAAFTSFQSVLYAGLITDALKGVVGRVRPEDGQGPHQILPFSGHRSFPSGHTTTAFAAVTPWVLYYPNAATYGLFALSAGTAVARIALDKHWPTDVLAGAAVGMLVGRYLTKRHLATTSASSNQRYDVAFGAVEGVPGVGLHVGLDLAQQDRNSARETMHFALGPALNLGGLGLALQVRFE